MALATIRRSFSNASAQYSEKAVVQREIGERLLNRLDYFLLKPEAILDLGAGPGFFTKQLRKRFPKARLTAFDLSPEMLKTFKPGWFSKTNRVAGDMMSMPFKDNSFDFVFANQVLHWGASFEDCFKEIARVLKPGGLLLFSTLGPDTFVELKNAFGAIDQYQHVNEFIDMHDIGDWLLQGAYKEPVVDMEYITVRYQSVRALCQDLKAQGVVNIHQARKPGLMTPRQWNRFLEAYQHYQDKEKRYPLTYEVIYGQAFAIDKNTSEVHIPISSIGRRQKRYK